MFTPEYFSLQSLLSFLGISTLSGLVDPDLVSSLQCSLARLSLDSFPLDSPDLPLLRERLDHWEEGGFSTRPPAHDLSPSSPAYWAFSMALAPGENLTTRILRVAELSSFDLVLPLLLSHAPRTPSPQAVSFLASLLSTFPRLPSQALTLASHHDFFLRLGVRPTPELFALAHPYDPETPSLLALFPPPPPLPLLTLAQRELLVTLLADSTPFLRALPLALVV